MLVYPVRAPQQQPGRPKGARWRSISQLYKACEAPGIEVKRSPFGWNKKLTVSVKGHPLAEQGRSYGKDEEEEGLQEGQAGRSQHVHSEEERLVRAAGHGPQDDRGEARPLQLPGGLPGDGLLAPQRPHGIQGALQVHKGEAGGVRLPGDRDPRARQPGALARERPHRPLPVGDVHLRFRRRRDGAQAHELPIHDTDIQVQEVELQGPPGEVRATSTSSTATR